jgi:type IV secretion system protein TrbL
MVLVPGQAWAAPGVSTGTVAEIVQSFYAKAQAWSGGFQSAAIGLFKLCLVLEIVIFGIKASLQRTSLHDIIAQFVMVLLFAGFIAAVINNYHEWSWMLINGLASLADSVGAPRTAAEAPFLTGFNLVMTILDKISIWSPADSVGYLITGLVVLVCFALITAQVLLIKCEAIICMAAAIILLGLGGAGMFKEYAINVMRFILAVAFKLFTMQLLIGLGLSIIHDMEFSEADFQDIFVVIGISIVMLALVRSLPEAIAGIINGSHVGSGQGLLAAASAVGGGILGAYAGAKAGVQDIKNVKDAASLARMDGASGLGLVKETASNFYRAHKAAQAESPQASHQIREGSKLKTQIQHKKDETS